MKAEEGGHQAGAARRRSVRWHLAVLSSVTTVVFAWTALDAGITGDLHCVATAIFDDPTGMYATNLQHSASFHTRLMLGIAAILLWIGAIVLGVWRDQALFGTLLHSSTGGIAPSSYLALLWGTSAIWAALMIVLVPPFSQAALYWRVTSLTPQIQLLSRQILKEWPTELVEVAGIGELYPAPSKPNRRVYILKSHKDSDFRESIGIGIDRNESGSCLPSNYHRLTSVVGVVAYCVLRTHRSCQTKRG